MNSNLSKKIVFAIRLAFCVLLVQTFCMQFLIADTLYANDTGEVYVSIHVRNKSLKDILAILKGQTGFVFSYSNDVLEEPTRISLDLDHVPLTTALGKISEKAHVEFKQVNKNISVVKSTVVHKTSAKVYVDKTISGTIRDENGEPLVGAAVLLKGTTIGAITNLDGEFTLSVPDNAATLIVSYIGYETVEQSIGNQVKFDVQLASTMSALNEVVVIGYGSQIKSDITGAVAKIDSKNLVQYNSGSFEKQLAGKLSGVQINDSNGQPGEGAQIVIRGIGTLTAGVNPLIVVDGFPMTEGSTLNALNPNDIADISILKDAASASIYGSRAANGVILVTTKRGTFSDKTTVTLDVYRGVQQATSGVELVDGYQFAQFLSEARDWGYVSKDPSNRSDSDLNSVRVTKKIDGKNIDGRELILDDMIPYLNGNPGLTNTNWMDEAFRTASMSNYVLSMAGGNEKTKYYSSLGYFDQEGVVIGTDLKRYSASVSLESKVTDRINVGLNVKPSYSNQNFSDQGSRSSGALGLIPLSFPQYSPYTEDGSINISDQLINETRKIEGVGINGTPVENLVATANEVNNNLQQFRGFGNIFLEASIIQGLKYKLSVGGDYDASILNYYYPAYVGSYRTPAPRSDADASETRSTKVNYLIENTLNYSREINDHKFNLLAGYTFQKENRNYTKTTGTGFPDDNIQNIAGASAYSVSSTIDVWALESYFGRLQYDFKGKYLLSAALRLDGSSRFGSENRWGKFPSLSAGWIMSNEGFFPKNEFLTFTKLSASWGKTGNNQIGNYSSQALVTNSNYVFGNSIAPGYISTSAPNPFLGWEIASSLNLGVDFGFFSDRMSVSAAYYKTNTKDLLLNVPVPQQTGYNTVLANIGEMENQGFEMQVGANDFKIGEVRIGFNANLTTYKNEVVALGPGQERIATGTDQAFITQVGRPIAEIYGYNISGVYKTQEEIDSTPHLDGTLTGDLIVEDVNNDGVITVDDKVSKGTYAPKMTYGFGSELSLKGVSFAFNFMGVAGRTLLDGDMTSLTEAGEGFAVPTTYYFENRYHPENNPEGFLGQPNFGNFSNARKLTRSSAVVTKNNGDYFRLRDVRIAYDFSQEALSSLKLSQLQIYASGNNLFTKTDFRGWNPDGTSNDILTSGYNTGGNYPIARSFILGLKISY